ncbi:hypothetical protein DEM27_31910 [Metarhizobium album]|uniref:Phage tail tape measure protein domain-containing protein n=1 Tax=Metarhizobium album TaxID=2182425 RepID=A0A2U2DG04_9HYPH|nr:phage tail tape measure protein [Rhizobium album]PWE52255.1 hypothetical protein DEM27_31910 [Rhizobium album]
MSDMDVSLKLRLVNQLSRPAEEAERDLKELQKAVEQLGRTKGGSGLSDDLAKVGRQADSAKGKIGAIEDEANKLRQAIGRTGDGFSGLTVDATKAEGAVRQISEEATHAKLAIQRIGEGFGNFKGEANTAEGALRGLQTEANETKVAIGKIDDNAFGNLKSDAAGAREAIASIGREATETKNKLDQVRMHDGAGVPYRRHDGVTGVRGPGIGAAAYERSGLDAYLPLNAGVGYMVGGAIASGGVIAGDAIRRAAQDEFTSDQLMVMGGYSEQDQAVYDRLLAQIGARKGVGSQNAMNVFGTLMAGGLGSQDAAAMTENAIIFSKATQASTEDAANTTGALRNTFGISADQMMGAYDAIAIGGKAGKFEVKDIAKHFPSIASKMSALGEDGMSGTRLLVALGQAIGKRTGNSDETAVNFENMLGKFRAQDFIKNAKGFGINPEKTLNSAVIEGKSPVLALLQEIKTKVGTDGFKLAKLMPDVQSLAGLEAALAGLEDVTGLMKEMEGNPGAVMEDFVKATDNASSAFDRFSANVAAKATYLASYALPPLTAAMNAMSNAMEGEDSGGFWQGALDAVMRGIPGIGPVKHLTGFADIENSGLRAIIESFFGSSEKKHGGLSPDERDEEKARPSGQQRLLFGRGPADPDFDFRQDMGINLRGTAEQSMGGYNEALAAEGEKAKAEAQGIADYIKSILGFTVSPTISPTYVSPGGVGGAQPTSGTGEKHSSVTSSQSSNVKLTQHISSPNSRVAALRAQREADRSVRMAQSRAFSDMGPRTA